MLARLQIARASFETIAPQPPQNDGLALDGIKQVVILRSAGRRVSKDAMPSSRVAESDTRRVFFRPFSPDFARRMMAAAEAFQPRLVADRPADPAQEWNAASA